MALQNRPLRPFEKGAHLHVLDWAHETARYRLQDAGRTQVRAAAKAIAKTPHPTPPRLPALEHAVAGELRKMYALGHATVRSELDHQRTRRQLSVGLSVAPTPPGLRKAKPRKGKPRNCATCRMWDSGVCWGYGNYPTKPNEICDEYDRDPKVRQLAEAGQPEDPASLTARGRLVALATATAIHQAIERARLLGITGRPLRQAGEAAGEAALRAGASSHAGAAITGGRAAAAAQAGGEVIGARYTSVLDKNTCGPCQAADDGVLRTLDDPLLAPAPNPACLGGDRCRCLWIYQLRREGS